MCFQKKVVRIRKVCVKQAQKEDALQGWVRIPEHIRGGIPNGAFVKISAYGNAIFCQVRGMSSEDHVMQMSEHYRDLLGIKADEELDLDIVHVRCFLSKVRALPMHPEHLVRFGFGFSLVGLVLGVLALFVTLLPYCIDSFGEDWAWAGYVCLVFLFALLGLEGYLISAAVTLFMEPPKKRS